ncbi:MAG: hypothetical protein RLT05_34615 [Bauldia litoralis]
MTRRILRIVVLLSIVIVVAEVAVAAWIVGPAAWMALSGVSPEERRRADAEAGDPTAQYREGKAFYGYLDGTNSVPYRHDKASTKRLRDDAAKQARVWLTRSARQGHPLAVSLLGSGYCDGKLFARDVGRCLEVRTLAARHGVGADARSLADAYLNGYDRERDLSQAVQWLQRSVVAAENRIYWRRRDAFRAAHLLTGAFGGAADLPQAFTWFLVAQKIGDAAAGDRAEALKSKLTAEQVRAAEAAAGKIAARAKAPATLKYIPKSELPSYLK